MRSCIVKPFEMSQMTINIVHFQLLPLHVCWIKNSSFKLVSPLGHKDAGLKCTTWCRRVQNQRYLIKPEVANNTFKRAKLSFKKHNPPPPLLKRGKAKLQKHEQSTSERQWHDQTVYGYAGLLNMDLKRHSDTEQGKTLTLKTHCNGKNGENN